MANEIRAFNSGRLYTEHGQRIAYCTLSTGNVAMVDIDRHIDYVLIAPTKWDDSSEDYTRFIPDIRDATVMEAYDNHRTAPWNAAEYEESRKVQRELERVAATAELSKVRRRY